MFRPLILLGTSMFLLACGSDDDSSENASDGGMMAPMLTEASAETEALWSDIAGYDSWSKFPELTELTHSETHSSMFVLAFYNDVVGTAMEGGGVPLPDGSIIVKENYMAEDDPMPMALTVMSKMDSEWYWVQGTPDGQVFVGPDGPLEGNDVGMCVMCHSAAADNDYVMVHEF